MSVQDQTSTATHGVVLTDVAASKVKSPLAQRAATTCAFASASSPVAAQVSSTSSTSTSAPLMATHCATSTGSRSSSTG